jgi:hypothetical protein
LGLLHISSGLKNILLLFTSLGILQVLVLVEEEEVMGALIEEVMQVLVLVEEEGVMGALSSHLTKANGATAGLYLVPMTVLSAQNARPGFMNKDVMNNMDRPMTWTFYASSVCDTAYSTSHQTI